MDKHRQMISGISCDILGAIRGPDIVLLHGWGCDRGFMSEQLAFFSQRSRVISPDFPGFGESIPMSEPTVPRLARRVLELLQEIGSVDAVVVGHSMGGVIALEMSRQAPRVVGGLAILDTVFWPSLELSGAISAMSRLLNNCRLEEALDAAKAALFLPYDNACIAEMFERSFRQADPDSLVISFDSHLIHYNPNPAIAELSCPAAYIATDSMFTSITELTKKIEGISLGKIIGSGHFAPLLASKQVNAIIDGFLIKTSQLA